MCSLISRRKWDGEQLSTTTQLNSWLSSLHLSTIKGKSKARRLVTFSIMMAANQLCVPWESCGTVWERASHKHFPYCVTLLWAFLIGFAMYRNFMGWYLSQIGFSEILRKKLERTIDLNKLVNLNVQKYLIQFTKKE